MVQPTLLITQEQVKSLLDMPSDIRIVEKAISFLYFSADHLE
jgi:hypothetical protein